MLGKVLNKVWCGRAQAVVNARVDQVFDYLADFARHPEWRNTGDHTILEVEKPSQRPVEVGSVFQRRVRVEMGGGAYNKSRKEEVLVDVVVQDFVRNERLAWVSIIREGPACDHLIIELQPTLTGTRVTLHDMTEGGQPFWVQLLWLMLFWAWPITWLVNHWATRSLVRRIKSRVEAEVSGRS